MPARQANAPAACPQPRRPSPNFGSRTGLDSAGARPARSPVADLIASAEKEYLAAEEKFKAGDLEAAKRGFDRAVDQLLQSPPEIRVR